MRDWLATAAERHPGHPAVVAGGRPVSYRELDRGANRAARRLAALGVATGSLVASTLPAGAAFAELLYAAPRLGAVLAPLDPAHPPRVEAAVTVSGPLTGHEAEVELLGHHQPDAVHSVIHTSGTSGRPKAVELTFANHAASAAASAAHLGLDPADRWLGVLPVFHVGGLAVLLRSSIAGATAVLEERFRAATVREMLERGELTIASVVPTMLARLRAEGLAAAPGLRAVLVGGGPLPAELFDWALAAGIPVCPTYGMTETSSQVATARPGERHPRPLPGVQIRIGDKGEILVRGAMVAGSALGPDGWVHTGDRGRLDAHGRLRVEGRLKEIIVTGGENVAPAEVEEALLAHPAVADAGVAGLPDPEWGEAVTAFVVAPGADPAELREWCREQLPPPKVPKQVVLVDTLPRNAAGKLERERLGG